MEIIIQAPQHYSLPAKESIIETMESFKDPSYAVTKQSIQIEGAFINFFKKDYKERHQIQVVSKAGYIQMHFELSTGTTLYAPHTDKGKLLPIYPRQHMLFYEPQLDGLLTFPTCKNAQSVEIEISENWLKMHLGDELSLMGDFAQAIQRKEPALLGGKHLPINHDIQRILQQLYTCSYVGELKRLFIESKLIELLSFQLHQASTYTPIYSARILKDDRDRLYQLKELLETNPSQHMTMQEMTDLTFMNRTKLQYLFKELFGQTIHDFVVERRMEIAYQLLLQHPGLAVADVARKIGYAHYNHFSNAFKKRFGVSPSKISKS